MRRPPHLPLLLEPRRLHKAVRVHGLAVLDPQAVRHAVRVEKVRVAEGGEEGVGADAGVEAVQVFGEGAL